MTDLLKAEVIEALAKELENGEFFHDGLSADLMETADKANAYVEGYRAAADVIRSFDVTPFQAKVPKIECKTCPAKVGDADERDCDAPFCIADQLQEAYESLSAQLAERDREIAGLREAIEDAPHEDYCGAPSSNGPNVYRCRCWKSKIDC